MPTKLPTPDQLRKAFDRRHFERGEAYWREGRVLEWRRESVAGGPLLITGRVRGSEIYEVDAQTDGTTVEGVCSCPVAFNCKHVVAVLLAAADSNGGTLSLALPDITQAQSVMPAFEIDEEEAYPPGVDNRLLYLLELPPGAPYLLLHPVRVRVAGTGSYGSASPFAPRRAWEPFPPRYLLKSDIAVLRALIPAAAPSHFLGGIPIPPGGGPLLERMLASGRCHWGDADTPPLTRGEPRQGEAVWEVLSDGSQRLTFATGLPAAVILPLSPPWYLDPRGKTCGELQTGLPENIVSQLLTAPPVAPEQVEEARRQLDAMGGDLPLPRPRSLQIRRIETRHPTPRLHLGGVRVSGRNGTYLLPAARLSFDYEGHVVPWDAESQTVAVSGAEIIRIERNRSMEGEVIQRLADGRLQPVSLFREVSAAPEDSGAWVAPYRELEAEIWLDLQAVLPRWSDEGWQISYGEGFEFRSVTPDAWYGELAEGEGRQWFDLELGIEVEGERISLLPMLLEWLKRIPQGSLPLILEAAEDEQPLPLRLDEQRVVFLPMVRLRGILSALVDLFDPEVLLKSGRLRLPAARAGELGGLDEREWTWSGGEELRALARRLRDFSGIARVALPQGFKAELRHYQQAGLDWLQFLREFGLGGILADDMGLGKTVQTLAHLLVEKQSGRMDRPSLVIAPTSLIFNWRAEAARFAPALKVLTLHGPDRASRFDEVREADLVLTTYPLLARDLEPLTAQSYHLLILDEAQAIKNPRTQVSHAVRRLEASHRLCLTGTPMENHLGELWSVFDFLLPGLLGTHRQFRRLFRTPIEKHDDGERRTSLARRIRPFFLRRTKAEVATELPPKTEILRTTALEGAQRDLYETVRLAMHHKVRQALAAQGLDRSRIVVLDALLKLRQVCCDPRLLKAARHPKAGSAKLDMLMELLPEMLEEGRRILLFSQFTTMLGLIEEELEARKIAFVKLTGRTRDRATPVQRFQAGEVPLFLISLKAGGTGLNLTAADTVIHYDPWWNPAVEDQATDRAHRIGQANKVFVYRLITEGTVEEKIVKMQEEKRGIVEALFSDRGPKQLEADDLEALFEPLR